MGCRVSTSLPGIQQFLDGSRTREGLLYHELLVVSDVPRLATVIVQSEPRQRRHYPRWQQLFQEKIIECLEKRCPEIINYLDYLITNFDTDLARYLKVTFTVDYSHLNTTIITDSEYLLHSYLKLIVTLGWSFKAVTLALQLYSLFPKAKTYHQVLTYISKDQLLSQQLYQMSYESLLFTMDQLADRNFRRWIGTSEPDNAIEYCDRLLEFYLPRGAYFNQGYQKLSFLQHCHRWHRRGKPILIYLLRDQYISRSDIDRYRQKFPVDRDLLAELLPETFNDST